jgi:hypothetical protein
VWLEQSGGTKKGACTRSLKKFTYQHRQHNIAQGTVNIPAQAKNNISIHVGPRRAGGAWRCWLSPARLAAGWLAGEGVRAAAHGTAASQRRRVRAVLDAGLPSWLAGGRGGSAGDEGLRERRRAGEDSGGRRLTGPFARWGLAAWEVA